MYVVVLHLQCNRTEALDGLFTQLWTGPKKLALLGAGCSVATEPTAEISHYYNIAQVDYSQTFVSSQCIHGTL